jgi:hypothetical protein
MLSQARTPRNIKDVSHLQDWTKFSRLTTAQNGTHTAIFLSQDIYNNGSFTKGCRAQQYALIAPFHRTDIGSNVQAVTIPIANAG